MVEYIFYIILLDRLNKIISNISNTDGNNVFEKARAMAFGNIKYPLNKYDNIISEITTIMNNIQSQSVQVNNIEQHIHHHSNKREINEPVEDSHNNENRVKIIESFKYLYYIFILYIEL